MAKDIVKGDSTLEYDTHDGDNTRNGSKVTKVEKDKIRKSIRKKK